MSHDTLTSASAPTLSSIIDDARIDVHYQPIVAVHAGRVFAYEALSRGPSGTPFARPVPLFQAAREAGLLASLESVCRERAVRDFVAEGLGERLFVNVSPEVLLDPQHRSGDTRRLLDALGMAPHRLVIELTEQSPGIDPTLMAEAVRHYQAMGFSIALDDLGEGYAGLRLWSQIAPDYVKLDRHFVSGLDADRIKRRFVRAIIDIAHGMGSQVIAEGVEREAELECLLELGADYYQGWLFAHPEPHPASCRPTLDATLRDVAARHRRSLETVAVERLCTPLAPLPMSLSVAEASERFGAEPHANSLAVVDGRGMPVGVLSRQRILALVGKRFGFDLYGREPVAKVMHPSPLCVEASTPLERVSRKVTSRERELRDEDFVVTEGGRYRGMGQVVNLLQLITEQRIEIARQANPLTQLPGNAPIRAALDRFSRVGQGFVACYLDLDHFKPFNDRFGYALGDRLLLALAQLLGETQQPRDFLGHLGGDDFVLLLADAENLHARLAGLQRRFHEACCDLLPDEVVASAGFEGQDRFGQPRFFPLPRVSIAALVLPAGRVPKSFGDCWSRLKPIAKREPLGRVVVRYPVQSDETGDDAELRDREPV
ncbi:EAL domain-containing protein [Modicisalibacter coralii]|uniref:EAL domain-containing protein n=1 Tax=Modicisalibacter coralii TaxID=2304602 RepID=UPI00100B77A1|nr:EAL domain-containing protein [Halomonas coralii]